MSATLTPIARSGYWRVKIVWPNTGPRTSPRYFGKFYSKAEAERWIEQHPWLTEQEPLQRQTTLRSREPGITLI